MGLFEDLRKLSEQIKRYQAHIKGEEATKHALVLPFLQALGYDIHDPTEIKPEHIADFATRRTNGKFEKVDYLIMVKDEPAIFVECKAVDAAVDAHDGQLRKYFNSTPSVRLAVVTNGLQWRFFTDLRLQNMMDDAPFLEVNMLKLTERVAALLEPFTKAHFNSNGIRQHAEEAISMVKITGLINDLLSKPSDNFINFIIHELDLVSGRVTEKVTARFEPIVKKSIETALLEMVTKPIKQMQEPVVEVPAPVATVVPIPVAPVQNPTAQNAKPAVIQQNPGIVTTEEELAIFEVVKRICSESPAKGSVVYKDGANYFAINLGPEKTWFLRLFTGSRKKSFIVRTPLAKIDPLVKGFQIEEIVNEPLLSRIYFGAIEDVDRMRPLILRAYEEAVQRHSGKDPVDHTPVKKP